MDDLSGGLSGAWSGDNNFTNDTFTNALLSCIARTLQNAPVLPFSPALIIAVRILQVAAYFIIAICGGLLNVLVLYLVCKFKKLQTPSFAIALQVSILNLLYSIVMIPLFVISNITGRVFQVEALRAFFGFFLFYILPLRVSLMFFLVVDRFLLVFTPFWYPEKEIKLVIAFSLLSWSGTLLVSVLFLPGIMDCIGYSENFRGCAVSYICGQRCLILHGIQSLSYILLSIASVLLYGSLYYKAKKIEKESTANGNSTDINRRQWKATVTFFLLFLTLSIITWPSTVLAIVSRLFPLSPVSYVVNALWRLYFSLLVITDPIVLMRNSDVREVLKILKEKVHKQIRKVTSNNIP